jgi:DNA polymerase III subunit delta
MQLKPEQLQAALERALLPVYLLASAEPLLLLEQADRVRAFAKTQGFQEREVFDLSSGVDAMDVRYACQAMGLFATQKLIELRLKEGKLDKELSEFVLAFCAEPTPGILLLLSCPEWKKDFEKLSWCKAIDQVGAIVVMWPPSREELPSWLSRRAKAAQITLAPEVAELLAERVEGNLLAAKQELDKLSAYAKSGRIALEDVESLVADQAHFDVFTLSDATISGDAARLVRILRSLRDEGEEAFMLLSWLVRQVELLERLAAAEANGELEKAFAENRIWPARAAPYRRALKRATQADWQARLLEAAAVDQCVKGRAPGEPWLMLERWLLRVALKPQQVRRFAA